MQYPQFGGTINLGTVDLAAANTASDGSGTIAVLLTGASKLETVTFNSTTDICTCNDWSSISSPNVSIIKTGDIVSIASSAGVPGGLSVATDYILCNLSVDSSTNTATFQLINPSTMGIVDITTTGTSPHVMRFPCGTRVDQIDFINSQTSAAASSANVGKIFIKNRNSAIWSLLREVALPAVTRSTSAIGNRQSIIFSGGIFVPEGAQLGVTIAVYASAVDRTTVNVIQASNF